MKKKTKPIIIIIVIIGIILLFPICLRLKDGGSKVYRSIVGIYEVKAWKQMGYTEEAEETLKTGITVKVLGMKIFDNTKIEVTNFPTTMSADEMLVKAKEKCFVVVESFEITNGEDEHRFMELYNS